MPIDIRPARPEDYAAYAALMPELRVDDPVPAAELWARDLLPTTLVAEDDGEVVGYLYHQIFGEVGYVRNVVSTPLRRRAGIGRALMEAAREIFRRAGATSWCLNVKPDNTAAIALYDALGLQLAYRSSALRIDWTRVRAWPPSPDLPPLRAAPVAAHEHETLELTHHLLPGQLESAQAQADRVLLALWADQSSVGVAVFNPGYPGCFPFRVTDPAYIAPLLRALESYKRPEHSWIQVVIEDHAEAAEALLAQGAELRLEILNLRARL